MRLKCKSGEYELSTTIIEAYSAIYPTADQQFAQMVIWLESNPSRRPASAKSAPRFIQNWFKRVPKRTKVDQRADTVRQLVGDKPRGLVIEMPDWQIRNCLQ